MKTYRQKISEEAHARKLAMRRLRVRGWTFERIGAKFGCSKQRVHSILTRA